MSLIDFYSAGGGGGGAGSHSYWRVEAVELGTAFFALSAMLFRDGVGSTIAATGGSAIEVGHVSTFDSSKLFDGTDATFWEGSPAGAFAWAGYNFATPQAVRQIALQVTASMDGQTAPVEVVFQYSDNGVAWYTAAWARVGSMTNDTPKWFDFTGLV